MTIGLPDIVRSISGVSVSAFETPRNTSASVSYTHLDVYKRQVEVFAAHRADDDLDDQPGLCRGALKRPESGYGISVSYTHLRRLLSCM